MAGDLVHSGNSQNIRQRIGPVKSASLTFGGRRIRPNVGTAQSRKCLISETLFLRQLVSAYAFRIFRCTGNIPQ